MDLTLLASAIAPVNLRSCLIQRQGELIFEHYRRPQTVREIAKINSCTKSVLSALLCIAMDQGLLPELSTPASAFFPVLAAADDPRKRLITLEHLLTMTAGFSWTEFGGRNSFPHMTRTPDWIAYVLEQPMSDEPGTRMEYNSGVSQMLSHILLQTTGMPAAAFAEKYLFGPLGITQYEWETDPQGVHTGGFGLKLRPADLMRFGQLYLDKGNWQGKQLISSRLAERSVQPAIAVKDPWRGYYCWHWWADSFTVSAPSDSPDSFDYFYARGFGGQFVHVIPKLDMVVVLTHDNRKNTKYPDVFREFIAPLLAVEPVIKK
ncbi:serine hydrolase domain-containing protein [Paenibacillus yonginensis]|nr:serine hydrolase [Paenibacillus yonginensis]